MFVSWLVVYTKQRIDEMKHPLRIEEMVEHPFNHKETKKEEAVWGSEGSGELEEGGN